MKTVFAVILAILAVTLPAHAYVGPGLSVGVLLTVIAIVLGIAFLLIGFLWYPIKRMLKKKSAEADGTATADSDSAAE